MTTAAGAQTQGPASVGEQGPRLDLGAVRALVDELALLRRESGSSGEVEAATRIAQHLKGIGLEAQIEPARVHGTYWWPLGILSLASAAAGMGRSRRWATLALLAALGIVDELWIGPQLLRRLLPKREGANVTAFAGPPGAPRTIVVHAHHDAAHSGLVFHPRLRGSKIRRALVRRRKATLPVLWSVLAPALLVCFGRFSGSRLARWLGSLGSLGAVGLFIQIGASEVVPGGLDNLSGVAVLLALAKRFELEPPDSRVVLVSTGSEESFLEGMRAWCDRHAEELPRSTAFVCLESVGCDQLVTLEGEGYLKLHRHSPQVDAALRRAAGCAGVHIAPRFRYRLATDAQVPRLLGFNTAVLSSIDLDGKLRNYHWPTDTPDRLDWETVGEACRVVAGLVGSSSASGL